MLGHGGQSPSIAPRVRHAGLIASQPLRRPALSSHLEGLARDLGTHATRCAVSSVTRTRRAPASSAARAAFLLNLLGLPETTIYTECGTDRIQTQLRHRAMLNLHKGMLRQGAAYTAKEGIKGTEARARTVWLVRPGALGEGCPATINSLAIAADTLCDMPRLQLARAGTA